MWLGFDEPRTIVRGAGGGELAAPVWAQFMGVANRDLGPMPSWRPPPGIVEVLVDPQTGYRVTQNCPFTEVRTEYFLQGTEPFEHCPYRDPFLYGDGRYSDTLYAPRTDTLRATYSEPGRTIFWRGGEEVEEEDENVEELQGRLRRERERRLDSLDALRRQREGPTVIIVPDTGATRRDTLGAPPPRQDTVRRDTTGTGSR